ncbi:MAG TPA: hypothetical protein VIK92_05055 [Thermaerobacter sp.]
MQGERTLPGARDPNSRPPARPDWWPAWLDAGERVFVRVVIGALVLLVMVQTWAAARQSPGDDAYGRVLAEWGYDPDMALAFPGAGGAGEEAGAQQPAPVMAGPAWPAGAGGQRRAQPPPFVITLRCEGPGPVVLHLNKQPVAVLHPGQIRPVAVRPGDRVAVAAAGPARGHVRVTYASAGLSSPQSGQRVAAGQEPVFIEVRARGGS